MIVKDLIKKLQECDLEATVVVASNNFELGNPEIEANYVIQHPNGLKIQKSCRDGFDGTPYTTTVWRTVGGDKNVVTIN